MPWAQEDWFVLIFLGLLKLKNSLQPNPIPEITPAFADESHSGLSIRGWRRMEKQDGHVFLCAVCFGATPNQVTVANKGLGWDSFLKCHVILVVTSILGTGWRVDPRICVFFDPTSRLVMLECGGTCSCRHWRRRERVTTWGSTALGLYVMGSKLPLFAVDIGDGHQHHSRGL